MLPPPERLTLISELAKRIGNSITRVDIVASDVVYDHHREALDAKAELLQWTKNIPNLLATTPREDLPFFWRKLPSTDDDSGSTSFDLTDLLTQPALKNRFYEGAAHYLKHLIKQHEGETVELFGNDKLYPADTPDSADFVALIKDHQLDRPQWAISDEARRQKRRVLLQEKMAETFGGKGARFKRDSEGRRRKCVPTGWLQQNISLLD